VIHEAGSDLDGWNTGFTVFGCAGVGACPPIPYRTLVEERFEVEHGHPVHQLQQRFGKGMTTADGFRNHHQVVVFQRGQGVCISCRKALDVDGFAILFTQDGIHKNGVVIDAHVVGVGTVEQVGNLEGGVRVKTTGTTHQVVARIDHQLDTVGCNRRDHITGDRNHHVRFVRILQFVDGETLSTGDIGDDVFGFNQTSGIDVGEPLNQVGARVGSIKNLNHPVGDLHILENRVGVKTRVDGDRRRLGCRVARCSPTPAAAGVMVGLHAEYGHLSHQLDQVVAKGGATRDGFRQHHQVVGFQHLVVGCVGRGVHKVGDVERSS